MTYKEYFISIQGIKIKENNLLFWNLWCLNYVFEKVEGVDYKHFETIKDCYLLLWDYNDNKKSLGQLLQQKSINEIFKISDGDYNNLDDFNVSEKSIKELIGGLQKVILGFKKNNLKNNTIYNHPINVIDIILDCKGENESSIFLNEANAHIKLAKELSVKDVNYSISDKNIYRKSITE